MSRKDYQALAAALAAQRPADHWCPNKREQWRLDVKAIADALASDNARFDRERFMGACEK